MQVGGYQVNVHTRITGPGSKSGRAERRRGEGGVAALLHPQELESLLLNIDASLGVHSRHQLFGWTQGMLQSLVKHALPPGGLGSAHQATYQVDSFPSPPTDPQKVNEAF